VRQQTKVDSTSDRQTIPARVEAMTGKDKKELALDRLEDAFVEDILSASDEEILSELSDAVGDPEQNAVSMRALFERSVLASNKSRLAAARAGALANRRTIVDLSKARTVDIQAARERLRTLANAKDLPSK